MEAAQTMIPVITGFLVLFVGGLGKVFELSRGDQHAWRVSVWSASAPIVAGIIALGCYASAMALAIMHSAQKPCTFLVWTNLPVEKQLPLARLFLGNGYWLFLLAVLLAGILFLRLYYRPKTPAT
jgi:hypothetical protein